MDDFDKDDKRPWWRCFVCGKHLGKQGSGGNVDLTIGQAPPEAVLHLGYGSCLDEGTFGDDLNPHIKRWEDAPHVVIWICDECIIQRHNRARVREPVPDAENLHWSKRSKYTELIDHELTGFHVKNLDFAGHRRLDGRDHDTHGAQDHEDLASAERAAAEDLISNKAPVPADLAAKLLAAVYTAEVGIAKSRHKESEAWRCAYDWLRKNAELLDADSLERLRERWDKISGSDKTRLRESIEWYEQKWNEISDLWGKHLHESLQVHDEINEGKPTIRGTQMTLAHALLEGDGIGPEELQKLKVAVARFFDRSFVEIMSAYAERGYFQRYFDSLPKPKSN